MKSTEMPSEVYDPRVWKLAERLADAAWDADDIKGQGEPYVPLKEYFPALRDFWYKKAKELLADGTL